MKSIIICDMEGVIERINEDGEKLFGYKKEELVGKKRVSLFSAGEIVIQKGIRSFLKFRKKTNFLFFECEFFNNREIG